MGGSSHEIAVSLDAIERAQLEARARTHGRSAESEARAMLAAELARVDDEILADVIFFGPGSPSRGLN